MNSESVLNHLIILFFDENPQLSPASASIKEIDEKIRLFIEKNNILPTDQDPFKEGVEGILNRSPSFRFSSSRQDNSPTASRGLNSASPDDFPSMSSEQFSPFVSLGRESISPDRKASPEINASFAFGLVSASAAAAGESTIARDGAQSSPDQEMSRWKEGAELIANFANLSFLNAPILQSNMGGNLGTGSYGSVRAIKEPLGTESPLLVMKLVHPREHYVEEGIEDIDFATAQAERDLKNEVEILQYIHSKANSKSFKGQGIQLPPYRIFTLIAREDSGEKQVGYLGVRYKGSLRQDFMSEGVRRKPLEDREFCSLESAFQLLQGLQTLNELDIIHGDINPDNILVRKGPPPRVDISDFGGARTKHLAQEEWNKKQQGYRLLLTQAEVELSELDQIPETEEKKIELKNKIIDEKERLCDQIFGTHSPDFTSPNLVDKERALILHGDFENWYRAAKRRDLYALGRTLRTMFSGNPEYPLSTAQVGIINAMMNNPTYSIEAAVAEWQGSLVVE